MTKNKTLSFQYDSEIWNDEIAQAQSEAWAFKLYRESRKTFMEGIARNYTEAELTDNLKKSYSDLFNSATSTFSFQTSVNTAYNQGRLETFFKSPLVKHLLYVAIVDKRTTELCISLNDTVFKVEDAWAYMPPNHDLCRSIMIMYLKEGIIKTISPEMVQEIERLRKEDKLYNFKGIEKKAALMPTFLGARFGQVKDLTPNRRKTIADRYTNRVEKVLPLITKSVPSEQREGLLERINTSLTLPVSLLGRVSNYIPGFSRRLITQLKEELKEENLETKESFADIYNKFLDDCESYESLLSVLEERGLI